MKKQIAQVKSPDLKNTWEKFYKSLSKSANLEACLLNVAGVTQIAWLPANTNNPTLVDKTTKQLLGKYVMKVRLLDQVQDGDNDTAPLIEVYPDSGWVESNFKPTYLATAQQLAIDYWQKITSDEHRGT